jgi:hypothetical protein
MPLSDATPRREIHHRVIDMKAFERDDGLYDIEAHLVDRKPFTFQRSTIPEPIPPGEPLHDLWIRLTMDGDCVVRHIEAASDVTPHHICKGAESSLELMVGERVASGWSSKVKERLRGSVSCTHLMEMLIPLATTALQGIMGIRKLRNGSGSETGDPKKKLNSCYAYDVHREVVKMLWPEHYRPENSEPERDEKS